MPGTFSPWHPCFRVLFRPEGGRMIRPPSGRKVQRPTNRRLKPPAKIVRPPGENRRSVSESVSLSYKGSAYAKRAGDGPVSTEVSRRAGTVPGIKNRRLSIEILNRQSSCPLIARSSPPTDHPSSYLHGGPFHDGSPFAIPHYFPFVSFER